MPLSQIGPMQTQFGLQMGGTELDQANRMRMIRLSLLNDFLRNFRMQEFSRKQHERAKTEQQQRMAMGAGSVLSSIFANPLLGVLGQGTGAYSQMTSPTPGGGLGTFAPEDILTFGQSDQFLGGRLPQMR